MFRAVDLSGRRPGRGRGRAAKTRGSGTAGLEFRAGDRVLAEIPVPVTGDRYAWTTIAAELPAALAGVHDLRLTLHGDFRLAAFRFVSSER